MIKRHSHDPGCQKEPLPALLYRRDLETRINSQGSTSRACASLP